MANENNDISEIVKKCKILLLDIEGTTTSISFVKDKLFPYAEANVKEFLESQWENDDVKEAVAALRKLAIEDEEQKVEGVITIPGEDAGKDEQIDGLVKSVKWQMSADRKAGPLKQLQGLIWKQGYDKGDIKGHVYDDVAPALAQWNATEGQKVYIYSSGSVQAQKLLFNQSAAGDLLPHIEGHFDTAVGAKQEAASYAAIVEKIGCKPEEILFLTDIVKEAEAARASGLQAALVSREGNAPLPEEAIASFPVLQSFDQLTVTNKRKPEPQEEEVPAKVPKTDVEANVKTASEMEVSETAPEAVTETEKTTSCEPVSTAENITEPEVSTKVDEPEKMEVEEEVPVAEPDTVTEKSEEKSVRVETVIEEVTASSEAGDAPVCDVEPVIVEESVEKTEKNETETMETEPAENVEKVETAIEPKEQEKVEQSVPVAKETPVAVEIKEVTNDQEIVAEGIELVEDLVPVVEEPPAVEMEDLNNVADVLDKECDEILLKVHDVTNLDSIPVKPLLNSIAEEDIDAGAGLDTNDIVDSILETEMELGVKPSENIDINIEQEISNPKAVVNEVNSDKVEENITEVKDKPEEMAAEVPVEENIVTVSNAEAEKVTESPSKPITEVAKEKETSAAATETSATPTEVTDGTQESPTVVDPVAQPESVVENNELKEDIPKITITEPEDNKMESDEPVATVESKVETKESEMEVADSTEKTIEKKTESEQTPEVPVETTQTIEEKLGKMESDETVEVASNETKVKENSPVQVDNTKEPENVEPEEKMESKSTVPHESEAKDRVAEPEAATESKVNENETPAEVPKVETESKESASNDVPMETEAPEKLNGKVNGESEVNQNGDASKEEELSARLSVENGENGKEINGANGNGDSSEVEMGQGDNKVGTEIPDIKVKTVSSDEPRTDPIDQPVEA